MFSLFRTPHRGEQFVIFADPAEGGDFCAAVAISKAAADTVLTFHARTDSAQLGYDLFKMAKYLYRVTGIWPVIGVERNTGSATIHVLLSLNYEKLFRMPQLSADPASREPARIGWVTTEGSRTKMLDDLALAVAQQGIQIIDPAILAEMRTFIRDQKTGKPRAAVNCYDDLVMATAGAWQLYKMVPTETTDMARIIRELPQDDVPSYVRGR